MSSFARLVQLLVWLSSGVAIVFGIYHHLTISDPFILVAACVYVVVLWCIPKLHPNRKFTNLLQLCLIVNLWLNGMGSWHFYMTSYHYDDVVHFVSPFMLAYVGLLWQTLRRKWLWPALLFAVVLSVGWEPLEVFFDAVFKTHTSGQRDQPYDTFYDILMDSK